MEWKKPNKFLPILLIVIPVAGGIVASFALIKIMGEESQPQIGPTTIFYAVQESEKSLENRASYRIILENHEKKTTDYEIKVQMAEEGIFDKKIAMKSGSSFNQTISFIPKIKNGYSTLKFLLYKDNETYRTWIMQYIPVQDYSSQKNGDIILYDFETDEKLELKIVKDSVKISDAKYTTSSIENRIIFLGETYEKILPKVENFLLPIILDMKDEKLTINETLKLDEGYMITLGKIKNRSLQINISRGNRILREILSEGNSSIEYWKEIDDYKKSKVIMIKPKKMNQDELVFDIIQYGDQKVVMVGNKYGEFQVTNISNNSITMKNITPIEIESGKVLTLMDGKIKIKV